MEKVKISFHASSLVCLKISAQNNFGNSSKANLKFFVPLAIIQTQNSKGRQIFQGKKFKICSGTILRIVALWAYAKLQADRCRNGAVDLIFLNRHCPPSS